MSSLPPPAPPVEKDNDNVTAQHGPKEGDTTNNNSAMMKRSLSKDDADDDRPQKRPARNSSEIPTTGTGWPNAILLATAGIPPTQNPSCTTTTTTNSGNDENEASPPPPPLPLNEQEGHQQQREEEEEEEEPQQHDATDTATLASSITYYVLRDGGDPENGKVSTTTTTTDVAMLGREEQPALVSVAAAATTTRALPANTVVRMRMDGQTLDLRVGDVVLLSGGGGGEDGSGSEDDISLADENAPPTVAGGAPTGATSEADALKRHLLWTARIEGFTGTRERNGGAGVHENDEISFSARWFLTRQDIASLPAGIPWVGPVAREALCGTSPTSGRSNTVATEVVLSSKVDDNDIACIRGRAIMKYNPTEADLAQLEPQQANVVYYCRYHLDVSDVNFSSYRLSHYDAQLHGPGTAVPTAGGGGAAVMDAFMLDNTMGLLSGQDQQQQRQAQAKQPRQGDNGDGDDNGDDDDGDDDESSDSDNDDSTDGGERRVVVEGEGSQLRESIAVGIMHQAVVGPFIPGQLHSRSRNPTLVWKASRHYHSKTNTAAAATAYDANSSNKKDQEQATQKFEDFLQRVAKVHTPFLTKHRLTTTDPYSPLPAHKAEALQRRRKQPILTGSFLSTASMLNVSSKNSNKKNATTSSSSMTTTIDLAAIKDDKSKDGVLVKEQGGEEKATENAASATTGGENDETLTALQADTAATVEKANASVDGEKDTDKGDDAKEKSAHEEPVVDMEIDETTAETKKVDGVVDDKVEPMSVDETKDDGKKVAAKKDGDDVVEKAQDGSIQKENKDDGPILECDLRKECVAEAILELWTATGENVDAAMKAVVKDLKSGEGKFTTGWTTDEKKIFDDGFRETQGELRLIAKRLAPRKTLKDVVDYHYRFKIPDQFRKYQDKKRELALRMMDCIEKRRFYDPTAGTDDLNGAASGGTYSRRGSATGASGDKQQGWEDTTAADVTGATEERRKKARDLLLDVQSKLGNEIMAEVMNAVRKLNRSYDGETRNSLFHLLRGHQELQKRFSEFLPRHF